MRFALCQCEILITVPTDMGSRRYSNETPTPPKKVAMDKPETVSFVA